MNIKIFISILIFSAFIGCTSINDSNTSLETGSKEINPADTTTVRNFDEIWVGAYMASWNHFAPPGGNWGILPTEAIDWDAFTHMYYFALNVNSDGTLSEIKEFNNINPDRLNAIVSAAQDHDKPILFSIGGYGNYDGFSSAIQPSNRVALINNLISILETWGFDGIDLDLEPINERDVENYRNFVIELRSELNKRRTPQLSRPLLSAATIWKPELFGSIHEHLDQINLMTYDLSGPWPGWVSWHNSPVSNGGLRFESNNRPVPSIEESVNDYLNAGVPSSKLAVGIDFYGYVWQGGSGTSTGGVTKPGQSWDTPPTVTDNVPYHTIMSDYFQRERYRWDSEAKAAYLTIDSDIDAEDYFITYDDEISITSKFDYVRHNKLGGIFIWELSGGYQTDQPEGKRDQLLQKVKNVRLNRTLIPKFDI